MSNKKSFDPTVGFFVIVIWLLSFSLLNGIDGCNQSMHNDSTYEGRQGATQ